LDENTTPEPPPPISAYDAKIKKLMKRLAFLESNDINPEEQKKIYARLDELGVTVELEYE
jgi:hypothetical protein